MKGTFNAYGASADKVGGNVPVWLGTVSPAPIGGEILNASSYDIIPAGTPVYFDMVAKTITVMGSLSASDVNGYLYNDVVPLEDGNATGAVVMAHNEGLLIDRVVDGNEWNIAALQAAVPNVILIRESDSAPSGSGSPIMPIG